jgi:major membrane immunogen (membrane-anchored lipoprotein)
VAQGCAVSEEADGRNDTGTLKKQEEEDDEKNEKSMIS